MNSYLKVSLSILCLAAVSVACVPVSTRNQSNNAVAEADAYCAALYSDPSLNSIRYKTPVGIPLTQSVAVHMMANSERPTDEEKVAVLKWAESRELCASKYMEVAGQFPAHLQALRSLNSQAMAELYAGELTFGEFARQMERNRVAFIQQDAALQRQANRDALMEQQAANQMMYQQQQLRLQRQQIQNDQNRSVNCTTRYVGNQAYTSCN